MRSRKLTGVGICFKPVTSDGRTPIYLIGGTERPRLSKALVIEPIINVDKIKAPEEFKSTRP